MQATSYVTKGGIRVTREIRNRTYRARRHGPRRGPRPPARRAVLLELRVSRPLYAVGHGVCRSAAGVHRSGTPVRDRRAQRARPRFNPAGRWTAFGRLPAVRVEPGVATGSSARSTKPESASPKRAAAGSRRCSRCCADWSICSPAARISISGSTARSDTIWSSSSSRCRCGWRAPTTSAISSSICRTRSSSSITCGRSRRCTATNSRPAACPPRVCRARPRRRLIALAREPAGRPLESDHGPGEYAALVERAKEAFIRGDLFEVVVGQLLADACTDPPSVVFHRLRQANPAPYGALINLGEGEFLVAASPEMLSGWKAGGSRPARSAARSRAGATRSRTPSASANCSIR